MKVRSDTVVRPAHRHGGTDMSIWQSARAITACAILTLVPILSQAAVVFVPPDRDRDPFGQVVLRPNSMTIVLGLGNRGAGSFHIRQRNYAGDFRGALKCDPSLLGKPRLDIDEHTATIYVPGQNLVLSAMCYAKIVGGDNKTAVEPILIVIEL
jgi:hypothetical protein